MSQEEYLREKSDLLQYEIFMFKALSYKLDNAPPTERLIYRATWESWLIHVRVLKDFFYKKARQDDIIAQHFFPSQEPWAGRDLCQSDLLKTWCKGINKRLAHFTSTRSIMEWEQEKPDICQEINKLIDEFLGKIHPSYLGSRWDEFNSKSDNIDDFLLPLIEHGESHREFPSTSFSVSPIKDDED